MKLLSINIALCLCLASCIGPRIELRKESIALNCTECRLNINDKRITCTMTITSLLHETLLLNNLKNKQGFGVLLFDKNGMRIKSHGFSDNLGYNSIFSDTLHFNALKKINFSKNLDIFHDTDLATARTAEAYFSSRAKSIGKRRILIVTSNVDTTKVEIE
jgi:hypothetical protein